MTRLGRPLAVAAVLLLLPGCGVSGLNFVQDDRVTITQPPDRARVRLPLTVRWTVEDFRVTGRTGAKADDAGYFGVLVDRPPPPPGETLEWLLRDDKVCEADPSCPSESYLASRDIYATTDTSLVIEEVAERPPGFSGPDLREVTVVLLDPEGRRIGESAFSVEFELPKRVDG
jgi:hypothetical protein